MTQIANDTPTAAPVGVSGGVLLAALSAMTFGLSGPLATGLLDNGWSPGAIVLTRIAVAALVLSPFTVVALRGKWRLLRGRATQILMYGVLAVAGAQFCYFSAVAQMDVGPALLIEYTAPAAVVVWLWVRFGQRPSRLTVLGALVAATGLVLVLDLISGADLAWSGVAWAFAAMIGATAYFLISADTESGIPPLALAGTGLVVGTVTLGLLAAIGVLPMHATTAPADYGFGSLPWWAPLLLLGVVTAAVAYATGIAAIRLLGSRTASFFALLEVVFAVLFAWVLVDQFPGLPQLLGGLLIIAGIVAVRLGDRAVPA
ncbi:EamA family transporter [Paractinoplanes ferrugineus]|uniref:Membrane protein n=1 Tax=Paractinoplanes ferrugineus TaxID=113564 RepID=A0A919IYQ3_9ACTN|nr:DMT family transporter [Actinoplanes ferrugineus]GIE11275.1 membrane protein [Actinoplanes ferrugineus]